jgi:hypothetical protein
MKHCIVGGLAAVLMAAGLIASAPPANAGCEYGGLVVSKCDGPVQPDGTWQRCVVFGSIGSDPISRISDRRCDLMGPDLHPWGLAFADPSTHIDD